jgi:acyl carrier protein
MEEAAADAGDRVLAGVVAVLGRYNPAGHPIGLGTDLAADLNVDSVAAMDLIMEIEDRFEIDIPINLVSDMTTVADLVALVERQLRTREGR